MFLTSCGKLASELHSIVVCIVGSKLDGFFCGNGLWHAKDQLFINIHQEGGAGGCEWCHLVKVDAFSFKEVSWVHFILQRFFCGNIVDVWNFRHQDLTLWSHLAAFAFKEVWRRRGGGCLRNLQFCPSSLPLFLTSENLEAFSIKLYRRKILAHLRTPCR